MSLSFLQARIERSIYQAILNVLVNEGYSIDPSNTTRYPVVGGSYTEKAQANFLADIANITQKKGFAVTLYGSSGQDSKSTKKVPRITFESDRTMPSDTGAPMDGIIVDHPTDMTKKYRQQLPFRASEFNFNIHLVYNETDQDRVMNAVLAKSLGQLRFITFYDDPTDHFFVENFNFYMAPDPPDGMEEKIYSFRVPDQYDTQEDPIVVSRMNEITIFTTDMVPDSTVDESGNVTGEHTDDGGVKVDNLGRHYL